MPLTFACPARAEASSTLPVLLVLLVLALSLAFTLAAVPAHGQKSPAFDPGTRHPDAPEEIELFGRFAGVWDAEMRTLQDDGSFPEEGTPARWTFRYILDGQAIQDEWTSPPSGRPAGDTPRQIGTGLRIYNPAEGHWEMAWISTTQPFVSTFEAHPADDGGIVMRGEHPTGYPSRTTFHDVTDDSFSWKLELQGVGDDSDAWTEVARIRATRAK